MKKDILVYAAVGVFAACVAAALIYLTPLKNIAIIDPVTKDVDPAVFYKDYTAHPDKYLFVDVRDPQMYANIRASGSISMPLHTFYDQRHTLPRDGKTIAIICGDGRSAGVGYSYLQHYGFFNIVRIEGGVDKWQTEGLPLEGNSVIQ